ncbi:ricin-like [Malania oleifera]|uniref:ricin-like n=1 Tax=Malania oleifera TaxID=397392 RepID=UPI0025AE1CB0|nr:ricin-like [Malania oleifera]
MENGVLDSIGKVVRSKIVMVLVVVVATWLWWRTPMVGPPMPITTPVVEEATVADHDQMTPPDQPPSRTDAIPIYASPVLLLNYPTVRFSTSGLDRRDYNEFVKFIRNRVANPDDTRHGIPVLRQRGTVPNTQRFLLVELTNMAEESVTAAIDVTNLYVVGYRVGDRSYFFRGVPSEATENLFDGTDQRTFNFTGDYTQLRPIARFQHLDDITLGFNQLDESIHTLVHDSDAQGDQANLARSLIICIIMISEAVRFPYIQRALAGTIGNGEYGSFNRNAAVVSLMNNWEGLSEAVQQANEDGVFHREIQLQRQNYDRFYITNVMPDIVSVIGVMMYICAKPPTPRSSSLLSVAGAGGSFDRNNDATCADPEPTVRISGRDGLCADVSGGHYNDGDPIILWPCKSNTDANQLWSLKRDGTIRSNGKCLSSSFGRFSHLSTVMIYDCSKATTAATRWKVWDNGTIINSDSSLVLTAESGTKATQLKVKVNQYYTSQSWLASNFSEPFVASSIVGLNDLCLQATGNGVWLEKCVSNKASQKWALYPDRSIRPHQNRDMCLSCNTDESSSDLNIVNLRSCSSASAGQQWMFRNNGAILNFYTGLVMDVRKSDPSLHQIIAWPPNRTPNQEWLPLL